MTETIVLDGGTVVTMDDQRSEFRSGHVIVEGAVIAAGAAGPAPRGLPGARYLDASGCMATSGRSCRRPWPLSERGTWRCCWVSSIGRPS